jgi:hypothetical protein
MDTISQLHIYCTVSVECFAYITLFTSVEKLSHFLHPYLATFYTPDVFLSQTVPGQKYKIFGYRRVTSMTSKEFNKNVNTNASMLSELLSGLQSTKL